MSNALKQIFSGIDGDLSSKRVFTFLGFILISIGFFGDLFWDLTISPEIFDSITFIVIAGLGLTGAEKFAPTRNKGE